MSDFKLQVGDVVSKPNGFMDWPKWEHKVTRISGDTVYTVFDHGLADSESRHKCAVRRGPDWMSAENMNACLNQPGTIVTRNGLVVYSADRGGAAVKNQPKKGGANLPSLPVAPYEGWSSEERCRHLLDMINVELKPKKPWTVEELGIWSFEWERWEMLLLALVWFVQGCSGGYLREKARVAVSTQDTLALQRLLEHVERFIKEQQEVEP